MLNWIVVIVSIIVGLGAGQICRDPEDDLLFFLITAMSLFFVCWFGIEIFTGQTLI
jgi:hypothetical protein